MAKLDRQWAFDTALNGLRAQGRKSLGNTIGCAYRSEDGLKCAVGMLIPDGRYQPAIEGKAADTWEVSRLVVARPGDDDREFLWRLQQHLHDELPEDLAGLETAAELFAADHSLTYVLPALVPA